MNKETCLAIDGSDPMDCEKCRTNIETRDRDDLVFDGYHYLITYETASKSVPQEIKS